MHLRKVSIRVLSFLVLVSVILSCQKKPYEDSSGNGGIVINFEGNYLDEWLQADSAMKKYDWKASFCISSLNRLNQQKIHQLTKLQDGGHEIATTGYNYINAIKFLLNRNINDYMSQEIFPMLDFMERKSIDINSFVYPYGARYPGLDSHLLDYFKIIRANTYGKKEPSKQDCYFNKSQTVFGLGMDNNYNHFSHEYLRELLEYAKKNKLILILYGHGPRENVTSDYQTSFETLNIIGDFITSNDMKFYSLSDLYDLID